jgi:hypothetical protein
MVWTLLPHLTACIAGESVLLLDLRQDRYFRLPARTGAAARQWLQERCDSPPAELLGLLERQGVVRSQDPLMREVRALRVEIPGGLETPVTPDGLGSVQAANVAMAVASAWIGLRTRGIHSLVVARRRWRASQPQIGGVTPERLAGYHWTRRLVPVAKSCLMDSLALDRWLGRSGPERNLVFGVTVEPFLAHCWLQSPTRILNDNYDHVRRYTPILVV